MIVRRHLKLTLDGHVVIRTFGWLSLELVGVWCLRGLEFNLIEGYKKLRCCPNIANISWKAATRESYCVCEGLKGTRNAVAYSYLF